MGDAKMTWNEISADLAEVVMNPDLNRAQGFRPVGIPEVFRIGDDGTGTRLGAVYSIREESSGEAVLSGATVVGLKAYRGKEEEWTPETARDRAMKFFPAGGTMVVQHGWYLGKPDPSVRITIENAGMGLSREEFVDRFKAMAQDFYDGYRQNAIWLDFYVGAEVVEKLKLE